MLEAMLMSGRANMDYVVGAILKESSGLDSTFNVYDAITGNVIYSNSGDVSMRGCVLHPEGRYAARYSSSSIDLIDITDGSIITGWITPGSNILFCKFSPDGQRFVVLRSSRNGPYLYDVSTIENPFQIADLSGIVNSYTNPDWDNAASQNIISFSNGNCSVVYAGSVIFNLSDGNIVYQDSSKTSPNGGSLSADGLDVISPSGIFGVGSLNGLPMPASITGSDNTISDTVTSDKIFTRKGSFYASLVEAEYITQTVSFPNSTLRDVLINSEDLRLFVSSTSSTTASGDPKLSWVLKGKKTNEPTVSHAIPHNGGVLTPSIGMKNELL